MTFQPSSHRWTLALAVIVPIALLPATADCQVRSEGSPSNEVSDSNNTPTSENQTDNNSPARKSVGRPAVTGNTAGVAIDAMQLLRSVSSHSVTSDLDLLRKSSAEMQARSAGSSETAEDPNELGSSYETHETYFFGIPAAGRRFVYLLDMSTSMRERNLYGFSRFQIAAKELVRAVDALDEQQEFLVVAFCYQTLFFSADLKRPALTRATNANKARLKAWLYRLPLGPGTDPRWGIVAGLRLRPDAIFLLSDGEFNGRKKNWHAIPRNLPTEHLIVLNRRGHTPIHTIAFDEKESSARLAAIARATGGMHRFVNH